MLDGAAHVARELRDERETEPPALALCRDERVEEVIADVGGDAGTVIADADLDRQRDAAPSSRPPSASPALVTRFSNIWTMASWLPCTIGSDGSKSSEKRTPGN